MIGKKGRKKSLTGYIYEDWDLFYSKHGCTCQPKCHPHRVIRLREADLIRDIFIRSNSKGLGSPVKVRITIEEIAIAQKKEGRK